MQVPNNHTHTQNLYFDSYYPNPKYLIIGYMDPLGSCTHTYMMRATASMSGSGRAYKHTKTHKEDLNKYKYGRCCTGAWALSEMLFVSFPLSLSLSLSISSSTFSSHCSTPSPGERGWGTAPSRHVRSRIHYLSLSLSFRADCTAHS